MHKTTSLGVSLLMAGGFLACSGSSNSPVSPSAFPSGGGATTITGTARPTSAAPLSFGSLATAGSDSTMEVCVVGADVCTVADASGRFEVVGDFIGDIQLRFSGPGQDVVVTVYDVQPGQTITVTVSLNGQSGTLQVDSRDGGDTTDNAEGTAKIRLCHLEGNGNYHPIEVSLSAKEDHLAHGDGYPLGDVPGTEPILSFDNDCNVLGPDIDIEKLTNGKNADGAPGPSIPDGDPIIWTYVVTNTGDLPLTGITVTDSDISLDVVCLTDELAPGATTTCSADGTAGVGQYENLGTVTATSDGGIVEDTDPSHYVGEAEPEEGEEEESGEKVQICHVTGNGTWRSIEVSINALPAHIAHGDQEASPDGSCPASD